MADQKCHRIALWAARIHGGAHYFNVTVELLSGCPVIWAPRLSGRAPFAGRPHTRPAPLAATKIGGTTGARSRNCGGFRSLARI
jgi:hypothetical protein